MKNKWTMTIIAGFVILLIIKLPNLILKQKLDSKIDSLISSGKLDSTISKRFKSLKQDIDENGDEGNTIIWIDSSQSFSIEFPIAWRLKKAISRSDIVLKADNGRTGQCSAGMYIYEWVFESESKALSVSESEIFELIFEMEGSPQEYGQQKVGEYNVKWIEIISPYGVYLKGFGFVKHNKMIWLHGSGNYEDTTCFKKNLQLIMNSVESFKFLN